MKYSKDPKIIESMSLTQNDINKMPIEELYKHTKRLTKEANRRVKVLLNSESMDNNPLKQKFEEYKGAKEIYKTPDITTGRYARQKLVKAYTEAYNLIKNPLSWVEGWKSTQREARNRFIQKYDVKLSYKGLSEFWRMYNILLEDPEIKSYVSGLDTNTLAQDILDIYVEPGVSKIEDKINYIHDKLVGKNGLLKKQYENEQVYRSEF